MDVHRLVRQNCLDKGMNFVGIVYYKYLLVHFLFHFDRTIEKTDECARIRT